MKILYITPFKTEPPVNGQNVRIFNILKFLSKNNDIIHYYHDFSQVQIHDGHTEKLRRVKKVPVGPSLRIMQFFNPFLMVSLLNHVFKERLDCVIVSYPWAALYARVIKLFFGIPYYLDSPDIEYKRFKEQKKF